MYGCIDPCIVYGWMETSGTNEVLSDNWLERHGIDLFTTETVRMYASDAVYGIRCGIDADTGLPVINEKDMEKVQKAYDIAKKYCNNDNMGKLEYTLAICGDFSWELHTAYEPDDK